MLLTTHAVIGAGIASLFPKQPALGVILAFLSHYALDTIPHWNYALRSRKYDAENELHGEILINKDFLRDLIKIGVDFALGLILAFYIFKEPNVKNNLLPLLGALAGTFPDALQFAYYKIRREPFLSFQKVHIFFHSKDLRLDRRPWPLGLALQATLIVAAVIFLKII